VSVDSNVEIEKDDWMSRMTLEPEGVAEAAAKAAAVNLIARDNKRKSTDEGYARGDTYTRDASSFKYDRIGRGDNREGNGQDTCRVAASAERSAERKRQKSIYQSLMPSAERTRIESIYGIFSH
jgi:hypothetical protein